MMNQRRRKKYKEEDKKEDLKFSRLEMNLTRRCELDLCQ